ncbi:MAG: NADH-quinone oxidoreductase subunit N [Terriglobia bacterium]
MNLFQPTDIVRVLPEIVLAGFAILIMVLDPFVGARGKSSLGVLGLLGVAGAAASTHWMSQVPGMAFNGTVSADNFSLYFIHLFLLVAALTLLGSVNYLERDQINHGEFYALVLMATVGMCFMAASTELILIFLGLEISSISTYILAGFKRHNTQSNESSAKYFLLGSFATAFFLYGIAFTYGVTGSTNLSELNAHLERSADWSSLTSVALLLMFVGLAFKVSAVPFQIWTPDVYQGAPAPVTAFLSVGPKAAAFAVILRVFLVGFAGTSSLSLWLIWISAILTMSLGNLAALWQTNVKRFLAYSSIAHAGYVLVGIAAAIASGSAEATSSVLFYLTAYALMNVGVFVLVAHLAGPGERFTSIDDFTGFGFERPGAAACLTVFMLSLAGIPTMAGFFAKFYVFRAAIHANLIGLTVVAVLNSVVSVYYYLRLVVVMYMREGKAEASTADLPVLLSVAIAVSLIGIFYLGLLPDSFLAFATGAAKHLR